MLIPRLASVALACSLFATFIGILPPATAASIAVAGKTYYVRPDGNDANDGLADAPDRALRTIQRAVNKMSGGDEVIVMDGTYDISDRVFVSGKGGTAAARTVIRSANPWGAKVRTASRAGGFEVRNSDYFTIEGFDVGPQSPTADDNLGTGIEVWRSNYVTIRNNYSHDWGCNGISFREGDYATIERNVARDNAKRSRYNCSGISVYQPRMLDRDTGFHIVVRQNVAFENECNLPFDVGAGTFAKPTDGNGFILDDFNNTQTTGVAPFTAQTLVENNLAFNNGGAGVKIFEVNDVTVRNNTAWHNLTILKDYSGVPGEISIAYVAGRFTVSNNVAVSFDSSGVKAFEYVGPRAQSRLTSESNLFVGTLALPSDRTRWSSEDNLIRARTDQGYAEFVDATTEVGAFASVDDFDAYFRLLDGSPGANSGNDALAPAVDLENVARPLGSAVERGCYEGTIAAPATGRAYDSVYVDDLAEGWSDVSNGGTLTLQDAGIQHAGRFSAKYVTGASPGALIFRHEVGKPGDSLIAVEVYARKWTADPAFTVKARVWTTDGGGAGRYVEFEPSNAFEKFRFPVDRLSNPGVVRRIEFAVPAGKTLWVDDLRLVYARRLTSAVEEVGSVGGASDTAIRIAPNPTAGAFDIIVPGRVGVGSSHVSILDAAGRFMDQPTVSLGRDDATLHCEPSGGQLAAGTYLVRLSDGRTGTRREAVLLVVQ